MGTNTSAYNHHWDGNILVDLMDKAGITSKYFSEKSGLSLSSIDNYRTNRTSPSVDVLVTLANFFNVPLDYLCGRYSKDEARAFITEYPKYYEKLRKKDFEGFLEKKSEYRNKADGWEAPYPYNLLDDIFCEPFDHIASGDELDGLNAMLQTLHPKEQICLKEYYENGKPLEKIGTMLGITIERVRQIIAKSLRKLRHPSRSKTILNGLKNTAAKNDYLLKLKEVENREQILEYKEELLTKKLNAYQTSIEIDPNYIHTKIIRNDPDILDTPIEELNLSVRAFNCLKRSNTDTVGSIIEKLSKGNGPDGLLDIRNLGPKCVDEIIDACSDFLGFDVELMYNAKEEKGENE